MKLSTLIWVVLASLALPGCAGAQQLTLTPFATGLTKPVCIENSGDDRLFVLEQAGKIKIIESSGIVKPTPFLDITSIVNDNASERGLLGLAFHPDYVNNGLFYLNYTDESGNTQISRFNVDASNPDIADASSEFKMLNIAQPYSNHNGGDINFGPDGYLYIGMGDGGSGGDPENRAQNLQELLGKMLRIDVDNGNPYGIPADNPFVGNPDAKDEIWALGVRNPWRFSFDPLTGDLWIADVGQNKIEEIDFQPANSTGGENYGWRCYEGSDIYNNEGCPPSNTMVFPVYEYTHSGTPGGCSVTGGVIYRGTQFPELYGHYFFTDFCGDWIMSIYEDNGNWQTVNHGVFNAGSGYSTFGTNAEGEIYIASLTSGTIYQISNETSSIDETLPASQMNIFPNPATHSFTADIYLDNKAGKCQLVISDLAGRKLESFFLNNGENSLEVSTNEFPAGSYLISILNNTTLILNQKLTLIK